jgi:hypothetical protein
MTVNYGVARSLALQAAGLFDAVLARVWLLGPGDECRVCPMAPECPDQTTCLHLAASAGLTTRTDGAFRRFPLGARRVGDVPRTLEPFVTADPAEAAILADPAWLSLHRIASFGAWPIHDGREAIGVLAVFSRRVLGADESAAFGALARLAAEARHEAPRETEPTDAESRLAVRAPAPKPKPRSMADVQREAILEVLHRTGGKVSGAGGAAEILRMKSTTLESRIRKLGLRKPPRQRGQRT